MAKVNKTSRYRRYQDGYWIKSRYLLYRFWYKFLQYAELDPNRTVDWSKYEGWGGPQVIMKERFELWWKKNWKRLFGVRNENDKARYEISNRKARAEAIRIALLVYEHRHLTVGREVFDALNARYKKLGGLSRYELDDDGNPKVNDKGKLKEREIESKELNQSVKRYRQQAERLLDEVCKGRFG